MSVEISFDAATNATTVGEQAQVFHCHYYNCALQAALEEGLGEAAPKVLIGGAIGAVYEQLKVLGGVGGGEETLAKASEIFRTFGFGLFDLSKLSAAGGVASLTNSHYAMGWTATHGARDTPVCFFPAGFAAGALAAAYDLSIDAVSVRESECFAAGADACQFIVEVAQ